MTRPAWIYTLALTFSSAPMGCGSASSGSGAPTVAQPVEHGAAAHVRICFQSFDVEAGREPLSMIVYGILVVRCSDGQRFSRPITAPRGGCVSEALPHCSHGAISEVDLAAIPGNLYQCHPTACHTTGHWLTTCTSLCPRRRAAVQHVR